MAYAVVYALLREFSVIVSIMSWRQAVPAYQPSKYTYVAIPYSAKIFEAHNFRGFSRIDGRNPWSAKIVSAKFLKTPIRENCAPRKFGAIRYLNMYMYPTAGEIF